MIDSLYCLALSPKSRENFRTLLKLVNTYMIETRIFESSVYFFFKLRLTNIFVRNFCKSNSNTDLFVRTNSNAAVNFFVDLLNSRSFLFIWIFKSLRFLSPCYWFLIIMVKCNTFQAKFDLQNQNYILSKRIVGDTVQGNKANIDLVTTEYLMLQHHVSVKNYELLN